MSVPSKVELLLCFNNSSQLALSIPLVECTTFAITPLKWLRFVGFVIYGRQGYLSTSMDGLGLGYTTQIGARSYYFVSGGEPRFADVDAIDNRTLSASDISTGRADFRQKVIERDGTCVLTGEVADYCDACYLMPHSKGDNYMSNLFNHRRETYGLVDQVDHINDIRNGILLDVAFRRRLDAGAITFLKTPNFALTVDDIPYHQPPNAGSPANRLTLQLIQPLAMVSRVDLHNSDARQPQDVSQWPPAIIVDLSYAAAVLQAWGPKNFIEYVRENSKDSYYESGVDGDDDEGVSGVPIAQVSRRHLSTARTIRYDRRSANQAQVVDRADRPTFEDMFDVVLALWMRAAREGERRLPGNNAADVADNKNKIQAWLQSIEESAVI